MKLKLNLLQVPRAWLNGEELALPLRRADALLYYLVCNQAATREELVSLLWEQCDLEAGRRNLRSTLHVIKKALGTELVVATQKNRLSLNPELEIDCDYLTFMAQDDCLVVHGLFLDGFGVKDSCAFDEWIDQTRERVKERYCACLVTQLETATQTGNVGRAERCALEYLQENPADEAVICLLMKIYRSQSRFFDGTQLYQQLHRYLGTEMGISPLTETTKLYQKILAEWNLAAEEQDIPARRSYVPSSRIALLRRLNGLLFPPLHGASMRNVLLCGEGGIGKTFLTDQLICGLPERIIVVRKQCRFSWHTVPYSLWHRIITPLSTALDTRPINYAVLLVLEDIQWADEASIRLLEQFLRRHESSPLSCLFTSRNRPPQHISDFVEMSIADRILTACPVPSFSLEEVQEYLQNKFDSGLAQKEAQAVYQATAGNPFLLERLCEETDKQEHLSRHLQEIAAQRLKLLPPDAQNLLYVLAFFSTETPWQLICSLTEFSAEEIEYLSHELTEKGFITVDEEKDTFIWTAEDLRCQLYRRQPSAQRRKSHQQIARTLDAEPFRSCQLAQIVYHYTQSGDWCSALQAKNAQWKQTLQMFCGNPMAQLSLRIEQELFDIEHWLLTAKKLEEPAQWLLLARALGALSAHRELEAVADLELIFSEGSPLEPALVYTAIPLLSSCAWENRNSEAFLEILNDKTDAPPFFRLLKGELLSSSGEFLQCESVLTGTSCSSNTFWAACACHLLGKNSVRHCRSDHGIWFQKAVQYAGRLAPFWGLARLYQDAGRSAELSGEEIAREYFQTALYLASRTDDDEVQVVAQAHLAVWNVRAGKDPFPLLEKAQASAKPQQAFVAGTVCLAQAQLTLLSDNSPGGLLLQSTAFYVRRGLMLLSPLRDVEPEQHFLTECLRIALKK